MLGTAVTVEGPSGRSAGDVLYGLSCIGLGIAGEVERGCRVRPRLPLLLSRARWRHLRPGDLDPHWGKGTGTVTIEAPAGHSFQGSYSSPGFEAGGLLVTSTVFDASGGAPTMSVAVDALDRTGRPVWGFGKRGRATLTYGDVFEARRSFVLPNGGVLVVGEIADNLSTFGYAGIGLAKLTAAGTLDPTFGTGGFVDQRRPGRADVVAGTALQPNGRIVVTTFPLDTHDATDIIRFLPDGSPDASFGPGGRAQVPLHVERLHWDGSPDPTFGTGGAIGGFPFRVSGLVPYGARFTLIVFDRPWDEDYESFEVRRYASG